MKVIVGVAEMKVSKDPNDTIVTHGLGSCLGVTVYDPVSKVGGLLHVMMPQSDVNPQKAEDNPFMFVETAVPTFFRLLQAAGAVKSRWILKVAGGALVNNNGNDHFEIGKRNYVALRKTLWKNDALIDAEDVGGNIARTIHLRIDDGQILLTNNHKQWTL